MLPSRIPQFVADENNAVRARGKRMIRHLLLSGQLCKDRACGGGRIAREELYRQKQSQEVHPPDSHDHPRLACPGKPYYSGTSVDQAMPPA
jgi:hypothetical protein